MSHHFYVMQPRHSNWLHLEVSLKKKPESIGRIPKATFPHSPSPWDSIVIINPFLPGHLYSFIWLNEEVPESKCVISKDKEGHVVWLSELAVKVNGGGSPNAFSSKALKCSESPNICASDMCPFLQSSSKQTCNLHPPNQGWY